MSVLQLPGSCDSIEYLASAATSAVGVETRVVFSILATVCACHLYSTLCISLEQIEALLFSGGGFGSRLSLLGAADGYHEREDYVFYHMVALQPHQAFPDATRRS